MKKMMSVITVFLCAAALLAHERASTGNEPCLGTTIEIQNVYEMLTSSTGGVLVDDALVAATVVELDSGKSLKPGQIVYPGMKIISGEFYVNSIYPVVLEVNGKFFDASAGQTIGISTDPTHECRCRCKCTDSQGNSEWMTLNCLSGGCSGYAGASCQLSGGGWGSTSNCSMYLVRCP